MDEDASYVRRRASKPKVKSGCVTCKSRHVKCDETKPSCLRCLSFWGSCEGYREPIRKKRYGKARLPVPLAPKRALNYAEKKRGKAAPVCGFSIRPLLKQPPNSLFENADEYRYFQVFQERTAISLSGYFYSDVWNQLILQLSHREAFVIHAVVAIGALDKTLEAAGCYSAKDLDHIGRGAGHVHHEFALKQYSKALRLMRKTTAPGGGLSLRNSLISCLLTICFESFHGNQNSALDQAQIGVNLLFEWQEQNRISKRTHPREGEPILDSQLEDLIGIFERIDKQVSTFGRDTRTVELHRYLYETGEAKLKHMPNKFHSLDEGRYWYDVLAKTASHFRAMLHSENPALTTISFMKAKETKVDTLNSLPVHDNIALKYQASPKALIAIGEQWRRAFQPVFEHSRTLDGAVDFLGANTLVLAISGRFTIPQTSSELCFDEYLPYFEFLLTLAREILEHPSQQKQCRMATFSFDWAVVSPLFTIATRCRDPTVRRKALGLLQQYPRREGVWDSRMAFAVASWFVNKEEEGMEGNYIPESARLRVISNDFDLSKRQAVMQCSKQVEGSTQRVLLPKTVIRW